LLCLRSLIVMRVVVQRVSKAQVRVEGEVVGMIETGLLVLVGFASKDGHDQLRWMAEKLWGLRIFPDAEGKMNLSATDIGGQMLVVSQFTLYGDVNRGRRPSFVGAAAPEAASPLFEEFTGLCREYGPVAEGNFRAMMEVELINDGPVTLILER